MPGSARRHDLYLPLTYDNGRPIPDKLFRAVQDRLLGRFGGLTAQQRELPLQDIWEGGALLYFDQVIIVTALDLRRQGSARLIAQLKQSLLREFDQLTILITEQSLRVH